MDTFIGHKQVAVLRDNLYTNKVTTINKNIFTWQQHSLKKGLFIYAKAGVIPGLPKLSAYNFVFFISLKVWFSDEIHFAPKVEILFRGKERLTRGDIGKKYWLKEEFGKKK